jgi:TusA-related sulfurtransferase
MNELSPLLVSATHVDARGRACPWPIIQLAKALRNHAVVELWADDPAASADVEAFAEATNSVVFQRRCVGALLQVVVKRGTGS